MMKNNIPLEEYPRPQFKRDKYIILNGEWDFCVTTSNNNPTLYNEKIIVPYAPESKLSGINRYTEENEILYYHRTFTVPKDFGDHVFLNVDSSDQVTGIFLNEKLIYINYGGYLPFQVDITPYLKEVNDLVIKVRDSLDVTYCYGKQAKKSKGMWYTKISGIWKTVWLEGVPNTYLKSVKMTPTMHNIKFEFKTNTKEQTTKTVAIKELDKKFTTKDNELLVEIENPHLWSPEDPFLYHCIIKCEDDIVETYFALREIGVVPNPSKTQNVLSLNGKPYFFNGLLDQGYFEDGIFTPNSYSCYENDIKIAKEMGFNTLRKHIKIEPLYFYYLCDKLGMVVFQDMVNNGKYNFFTDSFLPTLGLTKWDKGKTAPECEKKYFFNQAVGTMELLHNSPCVLYYTLFNEGWGQFDAWTIYSILKQKDTTRIFDTTSGWFKTVEGDSDVVSKHIYFKKLKVQNNKLPLVISEFGGYAYKVLDHCTNLNKTYGYKKFKTNTEYQDAVKKLYEYELYPLFKKGLSACIYTQLSDVEDETNGFLTYDRQILKVDKKLMKDISELFKYR